MSKTILLTGATDGIGLEAATQLTALGHHVLMHGRNSAKLDAAMAAVGGKTTGYLADMSNMADVVAFADALTADHVHLDVVINNAGVLKSPNPVLSSGHDIRFVVNTFAPYLLTQRVLPLMGPGGRVLNLSSAAQSPVDLAAMTHGKPLPDMEAYAQSKLAITMWSYTLAASLTDGPTVLAVNPGSLLASKMVKEGFGIAGNDLSIGADILTALALDDVFADKTGQYFDNDIGAFGPPHADATNPVKSAAVTAAIAETVAALTA
jgi:NAD(P)-dependent dehydrogenase (short-subunit alcohol dehydrogenase family)